MRPLITLTAVALIWPLTVAAQSPAAKPARIPPGLERVLKYVPDDTHLIVVVPSFDRLVAGISDFGKAIGVEDMAAITALEILEEPFGENAAALNSAGAFVLAISAEDEEPLLIASFSTLEQLASTTQPTELPAGARLFELADKGYVAVGKDNVGIFAREKSELRRALESGGTFTRRFMEQNADLLARRQVVLHIDVPAWNDILERHLDMIAQGAYMGMAVAGPEAEAGIQIWKWIFEQVRSLVSEVQTYALALRVDSRGVFVQDRATFKPGGELARYLKRVHKPKRDLLRGLPAGAGAVVFASEWELPPGVEGLNEAMIKAMLGMEALKEQIGSENFEAALEMSIAAQRKMSGYNCVFGRAADGKCLCFSGLYLTDEGEAVQRDTRMAFEKCPEMMNMWGTFSSATLRSESEQVGAVKADVFCFEVEADESRAQVMMQMFYGEDSAMYLAPHPEGVAYALGPRDDARRLLTQLLSAEGPPLSRDKRVVALFKTLSPDPQFCMLVDVPRCFEILTAVAREVGLPISAVKAADRPTPLAGFTFYLEPQVMRGELFVPSEPIKVLLKAIEHARAEPY
ncbi:MAG: hypothetical protein KAY37_05080 [Phycisphaerae bacterium]|nr:hypothetical protein [Phycisphaerae bacterium]